MRVYECKSIAKTLFLQRSYSVHTAPHLRSKCYIYTPSHTSNKASKESSLIMSYSKEQTNLFVNRGLLENKQEEILKTPNQIREKEIEALGDKLRYPTYNGSSKESKTGEFTNSWYNEEHFTKEEMWLSEKLASVSNDPVNSQDGKRSFPLFATNDPRAKVLLDWLLGSKEIAIECFKQFSIRPTRLNFMLSSFFYFIAICATIQRRENGGYLSILLQGKMPGYATLYQNSCWESFENLTAKYVNSVSGALSDPKHLLYSQRGYPSSISDIDVYKDRALLSLNSPWNKQVQKDFRAFFIDTVSTKNKQISKNSTSETIHNKESISILLPWYKIDSCPVHSDLTIATRENSDAFESTFRLGENAPFLQSSVRLPHGRGRIHNEVYNIKPEERSKTERIPEISNSKELFYNHISGLEYIIPCYKSKKQIFLENDSIPSKCKSGLSPSLSDIQTNLTQLNLDKAKAKIEVLNANKAINASTVTTLKGFNSTGKNSIYNESPTKYLSAFQNILNQYFYVDGLLLINLAETESWHTLLASISDSIELKKKDKSDAITILTARQEEELKEKGQGIWSTEKHDTFLRNRLKESSYKSDIELLLNEEYLESIHLSKEQSKSTDTVFFPERSLTEIEKERSTTQNHVETKVLNLNGLKNHKEHKRSQFTSLEGIDKVYYTKKHSKKLFSNSFRDNNWDYIRYLSGYKFPDLKNSSIASLFKQFIVRDFFVSSAFFAFAEAQNTAYDLFLASTKARPSIKTQGNTLSLAFHYPHLINQVLATPFYLKLPPALPSCYLNNLMIATAYKAPNNSIARLSDPNCSMNGDQQCLVDDGSNDFPRMLSMCSTNAVPINRLGMDKVNTPSTTLDSRDPLEISYKAINLPEFKQIIKLFGKLGIDYQDYLKQPKDSPFTILISPSLEDDEAIRLEAERKGGKGEKKMTPFQLLKDTREAEKKLEAAKDLRAFSAKNILSYKLLNTNREKLDRQKTSNNRKASFFGEMSLLPKILVAKDQKDIKEQIIDVVQKHPKNYYKEKLKQTRLPDLQLRAENDLIDFVESANLKTNNLIGVYNRICKADVYSSLKGLVGAGNVKKFCFSGCHKRRIASNLFVAPSQQHLLLPQISLSDWNKILEWQLKTYYFDEEKRVDSLRKNNPEKHFKIKKLTIFLPWVTFRTALNRAFEWPLTRMDFAEFVPANKKVKIKYPKNKNLEYMIAARNVTLSLTPRFLEKQGHMGEANREKLINKHYLFQATTNQSYLLLYRLFLFFILKNIFQYVYRISLRQFLIRMAYSDFGLTLTSPEFREWLQNTTPKSVYKVDKPLQSVAGIEQNIGTISQIIWNLRNFGRTRHKIPAVLLLGNTGAEKTSLVQAIASEAKVPVVVQPMDALLTNNVSPYEKLEQVFFIARKQAPCILFLDSLDKIGKSRRNVVSNYAGAEESLFCLDADIAEGKHDFINLSHSLQTRLLLSKSDASHSNFERFSLYSDDTLSDSSLVDLTSSQQDTTQQADQAANVPLAFYQEKTEFESRRINILLRLLTQIDGISPLNGVVVMATSEQSATLDPALLRPGRFQTVIKVSLPDSNTRIQLFKVESQKLGTSNYLPWDYLATRTNNMSGADIISAINHSAIRAILDNTVHTLETLEHGLNYVLALPNAKNRVRLPHVHRRFLTPNMQGNDEIYEVTDFKDGNDPFHTSRVAFYQAGKVVVQNLLLEYPNDVFFSLESAFLTRENKKSAASVIEQDFKLQSFESLSTSNTFVPNSTRSEASKTNARTFSATTRTHFQTQLIALYAGKAAELLHLDCNTVLSQNASYIDPYRHFSRKNRTPIFAFGKAWLPSNKPDNKPVVLQSVTTEPKNAIVEQSSTKVSNDQINALHNLLKTYQFTGKDWQSNLAFSDLLTASSVIHAMIDRWYLYSQDLFTFKSNQVVASLNHEQMQEQQDFVLFQRLSKQVYSERAKAGFWSNSESRSRREQEKPFLQTDEFSVIKDIRQERNKISWWNEKICQEVEMFERSYGKWYRLYLPKVEQRERNEEWVPPDLLFHNNSCLTQDLSQDKFDSSSPSGSNQDQSKFLKTLNDLYLVERDSAYYNVVINCFYKSYNLLNQNRELLDLLADHFIRFQILRSPEISKICALYLR